MEYSTKHLASYCLPVTMLIIGVFGVTSLVNPNLPVLSYLDSTALRWFASFIILTIFFLSWRYFFDAVNKKNMIVVNIYLLWTIISIIRGLFEVQGYWEWKGLVSNSLGLLLLLVVYAATNKVVVQSLLSFYVKYGLPLFLILVFLIRADAYGFYLMPVSFLLLFLPALTKKQRFILFLFAAVVLLADLGARSNVIKFAIPLMILVIYVLKDKMSRSLLETTRLVLIITPFLLFAFGVTGVFNVFSMDEYLGEQQVTKTNYDGKEYKENLAGDTRTFIYVEVLQSAIRNDYWVFGRTAARGNDSVSFGDENFEFTRRYERLSNEVGIANVFTWMGVIGVILYLLVFFRASYLAVNRSNNIYAKMMGIYVAFRWLYSWIEDVNNFTLNYFMLWIMIGLCFSYSFRMMSDYEVTIWIRGVFDKRYINFEESLKKEENEKRKYRK